MIKKALGRAREIFLYSDSEPNEILIGILHMLILPFAMLEIASLGLYFKSLHTWWVPFSSLPCYSTKSGTPKVATLLATLVAVATCANYTMAGMMHGSHLGWLLILILRFGTSSESRLKTSKSKRACTNFILTKNADFSVHRSLWRPRHMDYSCHHGFDAFGKCGAWQFTATGSS